MRKENEIRVTVVKYPKCVNWMLRYIDPITGKQVCKSSGTTIKKDALREASKWEVELIEGRYCGSRITWEQFRERYENQVLKSLAPNTFIKVTVLFDAIEKYLNPERLSMLTEQRLSAFQTILRNERKLAESTISGMLAHLRAALAWAVDQKYLGAVPKIKKPQRAKSGKRKKHMKGRPIVAEEFDRMLANTAKVVGDKSLHRLKIICAACGCRD